MRLLVALALVIVCAACSNPRPVPQSEHIQGPFSPAPMVWIRGDVKNEVVPWTQEITLAGALVAAEYKGLWDPRGIRIIRQGQTYKINPRELLKGREDLPLKPGDVIVIER